MLCNCRVGHDLPERQPAPDGGAGRGARDADGGAAAAVPHVQGGAAAAHRVGALRRPHRAGRGGRPRARQREAGRQGEGTWLIQFI